MDLQLDRIGAGATACTAAFTAAGFGQQSHGFRRFRKREQQSRWTLQRAGDHACDAARGIENYGAGGLGKLAGLPANLVAAQRASGDSSENAIDSKILSGAIAVANAPLKNAPTGTCREPWGPTSVIRASSSTIAVTQSAAGSACARPPPIVPRLRMARNAIPNATRESSRPVGELSSRF